MIVRQPWAFSPTLRLGFECDDGGLPGTTWQRGEVAARPHDDAEAALAVLAGGGVGCDALVAAWPLLVESLRWEVVRGPIVPAGVADVAARAPDGVTDTLREVVADDVLVSRGDDLSAVKVIHLRHRLPDAWRAALVATAFARHAEPTGPADDAALTPLAELILADSTEPAMQQVAVAYDPWCLGERRGPTAVAVPAAWFAEVWFVGAASIEDHLVLSLRATGERTGLARARHPLGREVTVPVHHDGTSWFLGSPSA